MPGSREAAPTSALPEGATVDDAGVVRDRNGAEVGTMKDGDFVPSESAIESVASGSIDGAVGDVARGEVARDVLETKTAQARMIDSNGTADGLWGDFTQWYAGPGFFEQVPNWAEVGVPAVVMIGLLYNAIVRAPGRAARRAGSAIGGVVSRVRGS